jgi:4-carboxymuconolactone decarboxylase
MIDPAAPERLPALGPDELDEAQREAVAGITAGPRGGVIGPFVPLLRSPELMTRLQLVGAYLRFESELDDDLFELAILIVARHWDQQFEWGYHHPLALKAGVPASVADEVGAEREPSQGRRELALVWRCAHTLLTEGEMDDELYAALRDSLGEPALVDLVATVGYYTTLALTMNVARTPSPPSAPRLAARERA